MLTAAFLTAVGLVAVHLLGGRLRFLEAIPRSRWLSIAGGVAVAYALVHLLPELQESRSAFTGGGAVPWGERLVYALTLLGLVFFYGLERLVQGAPRDESGAPAAAGVFWLHIASYAIYNALIGYLLVREDRSLRSLALFFVGIGLHFVVNDFGLRQRHRQRYRRVGRWILAGAILLGWAVGSLMAIHELVRASVVAFLAGGILLNTFKEELPEERASRFWAFALGAFGYAALMLAS